MSTDKPARKPLPNARPALGSRASGAKNPTTMPSSKDTAPTPGRVKTGDPVQQSTHSHPSRHRPTTTSSDGSGQNLDYDDVILFSSTQANTSNSTPGAHNMPQSSKSKEAWVLSPRPKRNHDNMANASAPTNHAGAHIALQTSGTSAANATSPGAPPHAHDAEKEPAANPGASGPHSETVTTNKRPCDIPESSGGGGPSQESLPSRPAKRTRLPDSRPARPSTVSSSAGQKTSSSAGQKASSLVARTKASSSLDNKTRKHVFWTQDEVDIVREARERGEGWDTIQSMVPRHTRDACMTKYQHIIGNKARSTAKRMAARAASFGRKSPAGDDGMSKVEEDKVLEDAQSDEESQDARSTTNTASPMHRSGFKAINHEFLDN